MKKVALFHPWIKSKGGAEKVVLEILKDKNLDIDLYTWTYDQKNTFEEFKNYKINIIAPKFAQKISRTFLLRGLFLPLSLFSKIPLERYDLFLISSSGIGEFITFKNYKAGKTYIYCHTILRAAHKDEINWNLKNRYRNIFSRLIYLISTKIYTILEKKAWKNIDLAIFNSELSMSRAKEHNLLNYKKSYVIYPPIEISRKNIKVKNEDYYFYLSRFNYNKRQDKLIKMWNKGINEKLILAGTIENKKYFKKIKKLAKENKNIQILTNLSNEERNKLYSNCKAVIFIGYKEDFGIVPFEAISFKKPLIIVKEGGYFNLLKNLPQVKFIEEKDIEEENEEVLNKRIEEIKKIKEYDVHILKELSPENFRKNIDKVLLK